MIPNNFRLHIHSHIHENTHTHTCTPHTVKVEKETTKMTNLHSIRDIQEANKLYEKVAPFHI